MKDWILGLVIFWGVLFLIKLFAKPANNGVSDKDYKKMQMKCEEEDNEKKMLDDYVEAEVDVQRLKRDEKSKRIDKSNSSIVEIDDDLPF